MQVSFERSETGRDGFLVGSIQTAVLGAHSFTMTNTIEEVIFTTGPLVRYALCLLEMGRVRLHIQEHSARRMGKMGKGAGARSEEFLPIKVT